MPSPLREPSGTRLRRTRTPTTSTTSSPSTTSSESEAEEVAPRALPVSHGSYGVKAASPARPTKRQQRVQPPVPSPPTRVRRNSGGNRSRMHDDSQESSTAVYGMQSLFEGLGFNVSALPSRAKSVPTGRSPSHSSSSSSSSSQRGFSPRAGTGAHHKHHSKLTTVRSSLEAPIPSAKKPSALQAFMSSETSFTLKSSSALGRAPSRVVYLDKLEPSSSSSTSGVASSSKCAHQKKTPTRRKSHEPSASADEQAAIDKWRAIQAQRRASFESEPSSPVLLNAPGTSI